MPLGPLSGDSDGIANRVQKSPATLLLETLVSYCGLERTPELEFKVDFFIYGEIEMGRRWMANRMVEQPEVLARRMVASMPEGMCAALDASALMRRGKI